MILPPGIHEKKALAALTWFHSGGEARYYCRPREVEEMIESIRWAHKEEIPIYLLGLGANSLFPDGDLDGLVIHMNRFRCGIDSFQFHAADLIEVPAGVALQNLIADLNRQGLAGFEHFVGIPGTVGGSVWGNAGAQGHGIGESVEAIQVLEKTGELHWLTGDVLPWDYRYSGLEDRIVLSVRFRVQPGADPDFLNQKSREFLDYKYSVQPFDQKSTGCIFRNPSEGPSAGQLIEAAGLKGVRCGGAQISEKHANFIVNPQKTATTQDVLSLSHLIRETVQAKAGVLLRQEVVVIGMDNDAIRSTDE